MLGTILIVILLLALFGALPRWSHSRSWGYAPTGGIGIILLIVVILLVVDESAHERHRSCIEKNRKALAPDLFLRVRVSSCSHLQSRTLRLFRANPRRNRRPALGR